jgi:hypothetical protein
MKRRARRAVIGAAALVAALLSVLVVTHWGAVRDHVEAWHFQLTRDTKTIDPVPEGMPARGTPYTEEDVLHFAADRLRCPLIVDHREEFFFLGDVSGNSIRDILEKNRWRVLEQRFPRRAYVVIRAADPQDGQPIVVPPQSLLPE